jgi:hypothetical protein
MIPGRGRLLARRPPPPLQQHQRLQAHGHLCRPQPPLGRHGPQRGRCRREPPVRHRHFKLGRQLGGRVQRTREADGLEPVQLAPAGRKERRRPPAGLEQPRRRRQRPQQRRQPRRARRQLARPHGGQLPPRHRAEAVAHPRAARRGAQRAQRGQQRRKGVPAEAAARQLGPRGRAEVGQPGGARVEPQPRGRPGQVGELVGLEGRQLRAQQLDARRPAPRCIGAAAAAAAGGAHRRVYLRDEAAGRRRGGRRVGRVERRLPRPDQGGRSSTAAAAVVTQEAAIHLPTKAGGGRLLPGSARALLVAPQVRGRRRTARGAAQRCCCCCCWQRRLAGDAVHRCMPVFQWNHDHSMFSCCMGRVGVHAASLQSPTATRRRKQRLRLPAALQRKTHLMLCTRSAGLGAAGGSLMDHGLLFVPPNAGPFIPCDWLSRVCGLHVVARPFSQALPLLYQGYHRSIMRYDRLSKCVKTMCRPCVVAAHA